MTALHERLQDVIAEMRAVCPHEERFGDQLHEWADRLVAATALQSSGGEVVVPSGEEFRLLMGEMDTEQVCIAQAAFRMGAQAVLASPAQPSGFVLVPDDVIAFLNGTGELHGCTFGETPPGVRGKYWWRNYLTAAPAPIEQEG